MTDVAEIARGLTKAQRTTIVWMDDIGTWCRPDRRSMPALIRKGLAESKISHAIIYDRLLPLGLAVRDYLKEQG